MSSRNLFLLAQTGFRHMFGCVYLNCCSTSLITVWQSKHRKVPLMSSGWTGCVRTTCPLMRVSKPILDAVSSRILFRDGCPIGESRTPKIWNFNYKTEWSHLCFICKYTFCWSTISKKVHTTFIVKLSWEKNFRFQSSETLPLLHKPILY